MSFRDWTACIQALLIPHCKCFHRIEPPLPDLPSPCVQNPPSLTANLKGISCLLSFQCPYSASPFPFYTPVVHFFVVHLLTLVTFFLYDSILIRLHNIFSLDYKIFKRRQPILVIKKKKSSILSSSCYVGTSKFITPCDTYSLSSLFVLDISCLLTHSVPEPLFIVIYFISFIFTFGSKNGKCLIWPGIDSNLDYED